MYGADYAWILQETFENQRWWERAENSECSLKNLHTAVESVLIVSSYNNIVGEEKSISGLVCDKRRLPTEKGLHKHKKNNIIVSDKLAFRAGTFVHECFKAVFTFRARNL